MGAVLNVVKRTVPASYRALVTATNNYYSQTDLQSAADYVQFRLYSTVVGATNEATSYNVKEVELLGILTTLQFIPAAIDYWGDQYVQETATGTREIITYLDRREELWNVFKKLQEEAKQLANEMGLSFGVAAVFPKVSYGDNGREVLITTDPQEFPPAYSKTKVSDLIPWGTV